jgi:hypothetical protein
MLVIVAILVHLLLLSACPSLMEPAIKREARAKAQEWWDASVSRCGGDYYTKIMRDDIVMAGRVFEIEDKPPIQFKPVTYELLEEPITEADRLNGVEWKGYATFPTKLTFRYYDSRNKKWSSWREGTIIYQPNELRELRNKIIGRELDAPLIQELRKEKGKWNYERGDSEKDTANLAKPNCSEIPKD